MLGDRLGRAGGRGRLGRSLGLGRDWGPAWFAHLTLVNFDTFGVYWRDKSGKS